MALRGWRLFGVAGTISVYLAGILLLSFMRLNGPPQRNRYDIDASHSRDALMVAKRQPLQWCQSLRYLSEAEVQHKPAAAASSQQQPRPPRPRQTFAGHFVRPLERRLQSLAEEEETAATVALIGPIEPVIESRTRSVAKQRRRDGRDTTMAEAVAVEQQQHKSKVRQDNNSPPVTMRPAGSGNRLLHQHLQYAARNNKKLQLARSLKAGRKEIKTLSDSTERNLVALASFPGSGNTWLRYLLQQATGIYTGSIYRDFGLLKSGFPAENVFNSSVLVVKTHEWGPSTYEHFSKAILLMRDPDKAIMAEFNRQSGGHVGFAAPDRFKRTKGRYWHQFFTKKLAVWEEMNMHWARNYTGELLIVYYDDLIADVEGVLRSILKFIHFPIDEELLSCAVQRKEGIYRRKKRIRTFDPYTPEMQIALEQRKRHVYSELGRNRF